MSDSVGKISLDLEVTSDLVKQISAVSNAMGKKLKDTMDSATKSMFDGMNGNMNKSMQSMNSALKSGLSKMKQNIRNTFSSGLDVLKNIKMPTTSFPKMNILKPKASDVTQEKTTRGPPTFNAEALKAQIDNVGKTLDTTNAKIEQQQSKLAALKQEYASAFNQDRKNKLEEQILKTESSINKLIGTSDKLGFKLAELDEKFAMAGAEAKTAGKDFNTLESKTKSLGNNANKTNAPTKGLFNSLKNLGSSAKTSSSHLSNHNSQIKMIARSMFTWGIVFPMILKGLQAMGSGLLADLNTNTQFANSLAQIKTNLSVAFTPIFYAILPAINALMSTLATVTTYIASFVSSIFGKTYQQSFQATQGLINAKEAMGAYGDSAKKAAKDSRELAGFDEINKLSSNKDSGGAGSGSKSKVPTLVQPNVNTSVADGKMKALADKIKALMSQVFKPFQQAWAAEGVNTVNSIKYAFSEIGALIGAIGKSFLSVWTNGTGRTMLTLILQICQNIFNLVGDIANTFTIAWNNGGIGTTIIQEVANTINNLLLLIKKIGDSLRQSWGVVGQGVANTFMQVINSTIGVLENLTSKLAYVWDNGGSHLFEGFAKLGAKVLELAGYIYTNFITPLANGFINIASPAIAKVLDVVGSLLTKFSELITWLLGSGKPVLDTIVIVLGSFATAWGLVTLAVNLCSIATGAWSVVCGIATGVMTAFGAVMAFITSPIGIVIAVIGSLIAIGVLLYKHWDTVKIAAAACWSYVQVKFQQFKDWLGNVFATDWTQKFGIFGNVINSFVATARDYINSIKNIFNGITEFISGVFSGNWSKAWQGIKDIFKGIMGNLALVVKGPLNAVIGLVNGAIDGLNGLSFDLPDIMGGGHVGISIPKIPYLAKGGIVDSPTLAMVGEAGKEAVMPLENNTGWISNLAGQIAAKIGVNSNQVAATEQSGDLILMIDSSVIGQAAIKELRKMQRQGGITLIPT